MTDRPTSAEAGTFFVSVMALSLATWPISFTLGAYAEVFYRDVFTIWVASLAALLAVLWVGKTSDGETYFTWWGAMLLLVPTVLMCSQVLGLTQYDALIAVLEWFLLIISVPYIGYILLVVAAPESIELGSKRLVLGLITSVICVNLCSFAVGYYNAYFMECADFLQAGDAAPNGCWRPQLG